MNASIKDGGPAFPGGVNLVYTNIDAGEPTQAGMTLRDYFAAQVISASYADSWAGFRQGKYLKPADDEIAEDAYAMADAMLRAREVQP